MTRRAGAYLRYSTDKQRAESIEDQRRMVGEFAQRRGFDLLDDYVAYDAAESGRKLKLRRGLSELLNKVCITPAPIDVLLVDDLSRLSRDEEHFYGILKRLHFAGIEMIGVADGLSSKDAAARLGIGIKVMMSAYAIEEIRYRTKRGLIGLADAGLSTGGRCFGYTAVPTGNKDSKRLVLNEAEAAVVRHAFDLAEQGLSLSKIVKVLDAEHAPAPDPGDRKERRRGWCVSSLREVLRRPLYAGQRVWNRKRSMLNPDTEKRVFRENPADEWRVKEVPELRIISQEQFEKVQVILAERGARYTRKPDGRLAGQAPGTSKSTYLLSGVLKCGVCGGGMTIYGGRRSKTSNVVYRGYRCAFSTRRGDAECSNKVTLSKLKLEEAVIDALRTKILTPEMLDLYEAEFETAYTEAVAELHDQRRLTSVRDAVAEQRAKVERLADLMEKTGSETFSERFTAAEQKLRELEAELERAQARDPVMPHPAALRAALDDLVKLLDTDPVQAKESLRALLGGELRLTPKRVSPGESDTVNDVSEKLGKKKSRPTWVYEVAGSVYLQNILVPASRPGPVCLSVVAGARNARQANRTSRPAPLGPALPFVVEVPVHRGPRVAA